MFIRWDNAGSKLGRQISIDQFGRIKSIVFFKIPQVDFTCAEILIPDTGGVMLKMKGRERADMPKWAIIASNVEK